MKDGKAEERLQQDKKYVSVKSRKTSPELNLPASHQQETLKHNAAPPNDQAEHFSPAQTQEDRTEGILT
jgi:hypothetical protein